MNLTVPARLAGPLWGRLGALTERSWPYRVGLRYVILLLALVLCTLVLVGVVASNSVYLFTRAAAYQRVAGGEAAFLSLARERQRQLETLTLWLSRDVALRNSALAVESPTDAALLKLLSLGGADFIGVQTRQGDARVVPSELAPLIVPVNDVWLSLPEMRDDTMDFSVLRAVDGSLFWQGQMRLPSGDSVLAGHFLGHAFAEEFRARTGLDLTLFSDGRPLSTTLVTSEGDRALQIDHAPDVPTAAQHQGIMGPGSFEVEGNLQTAFYFPMRDRTGQIVATYAVSLPAPPRWPGGLSLDHLAYVLLLGLLAVAALSGLLLARRVVVPIGGLRRAVSRIERGDLATPVSADAVSDEVRPLARELEDMRRSMLEALNQLAIERSLYKGTFHAMADGVFTTNEQGMMTSVNPSLLGSLAQEFAPSPGAQCCGTSVLRDVEGRSLCDRACTWLWFRGRAEPVVVKGYLETTTAEPRDVEITITPVKDDDQQTVGLVHVVRDISVQEQIQRLKERFLMSVSHELRTPLSALSSSVDFLKDEFAELDPADRDRLLDAVRRGTLRLQALTTNLLDLGSIQAGSFTVRPETVSVEGPIREALAMSEVLLAGKGQGAVLEVPPGLRAVRADSVRVVQVVANLLANASKYGPENDTILISVHEERDRVRVAITDHGDGIPPEEKQRVFDYFFRGAEAARTEKGFGIGLALVKGIVDAHEGEVGVESEPGAGTRFWFTLPVAR